MRVTKSKLKQLIKEELQNILEQGPAMPPSDFLKDILVKTIQKIPPQMKAELTRDELHLPHIFVSMISCLASPECSRNSGATINKELQLIGRIVARGLDARTESDNF